MGMAGLKGVEWAEALVPFIAHEIFDTYRKDIAMSEKTVIDGLLYNISQKRLS